MQEVIFPIQRLFTKPEPKSYYGLIEEVVESDPNNERSRSFLLIDSIISNRFDRDGPQTLEDRSALALVRMMSTPQRWEEQFGLGELATGDWLAFELDDGGSVPRAWELNAAGGYRSGPSRSIRAMRRLNGPTTTTQPDDIALLAKLMDASRYMAIDDA